MQEVRDAYKESLSQLTFNSRPVIMSLTELANEYSAKHAVLIVRLIEERMRSVQPNMKLPCLYLMDSIVKNHPSPYKDLFQQNLDVKVRGAMHRLRLTWNEIFSSTKLYQLDMKVQSELDPKWPVATPASGKAAASPANIHINPAVFNRTMSLVDEDEETKYAREIKEKKMELMRLQKLKIEKELEAMRKAVLDTENSKEDPLAKDESLTKSKKTMAPTIATKKPSTTSSSKDSSSLIKESSKSKSIVGRHSPDSSSGATSAAKQRDPRIRSGSSKKSTSSSESSRTSRKSSSPVPVKKSSKASAVSSRTKSEESKGADDLASAKKSSATTAGSPVAPRKRGVTESPTGKTSSKHRRATTASPDSSPSPPPKLVASKEEEKLSRRPNLEEEKEDRKHKPFRIPKKSTKSSPSGNEDASEGFEEEGPHVEFNRGKRLVDKKSDQQKRGTVKRRITGRQAQSGSKKSKLNLELFGDEQNQPHESPSPPRDNCLPSPSVGWAKFKETNPDEYRSSSSGGGGKQQPRWNRGNQQQRGRAGGGDEARQNFRGRGGGRNLAGRGRSHARDRFGGGTGGGGGGDDNMPFSPSSAIAAAAAAAFSAGPALGNFFADMHSFASDPKTVETVIIPQIMGQAKDGLRTGALSQEQFSDLMKQILILKEQAMMKQADRRQMQMENKENQLGWMQFQQQQGPGQQMPQQPPYMGIGPPPQQPPMGFANSPNMPPPPQPPPFLDFRPPGPMPPQGGFSMHGPSSRSPFGPPDLRIRDLPQANEEELEAIRRDPFKTINIDNQPREIRFYSDIATAVMDDNDVRELSFERLGPSGFTRRILIDGDATIVPPPDVGTGEYVEFVVDGITHKAKIGAPTRELWIDDCWYECYFDKSVDVPLGPQGAQGSLCRVLLEGPAPNVRIGAARPDLCAGFVSLIVDGDVGNWSKIYLDSKPQLLEVDGKPHVLRFVDEFKVLLINGHPFRPDFGGLPMVIYVNGNKHFLRLSTLPRGVRLGPQHQNVVHRPDSDRDPRRSRKSPRPRDDAIPTEAAGPDTERKSDSPPFNQPPALQSDTSNDGFDAVDRVMDSNEAYDKLLKLIPGSGANLKTEGERAPSECDYSAARESSEKPAKESLTSPAVNVHDLWTQLLGAGLVGTGENAKNAPDASTASSSAAIPGLEVAAPPVVSSSIAKTPTEDVAGEKESVKVAEEATAMKKKRPVASSKEIKPITLKSHHPSLKERQLAVIEMLYDKSPLQCKNCGLRYQPSEMLAYSHHLDWHFRMNRRGKENRTQSRKWYFEREDWIISDEIEDDDKDLAEGENRSDGDRSSPANLPSVAVSDDEKKKKEEGVCPVCKEEFDQFYKEDGTDDDNDSRWHYRNAVRPDDQPVGEERVYHPQCYQDHLSRKDDSHANSSLLEDSANHDDDDEMVDMTTEVKKEPLDQLSESDQPMETDQGDGGDEEKQVNVPPAEIKTEKSEEEKDTSESVTAEEVTPGEDLPNGVRVKADPEEVKEELSEAKVESEEEPEATPGEGDTKPEHQENVAVKEEKKEDIATLEDVDAHSQQQQAAVPPVTSIAGIKINITSQVDRAERQDSTIASDGVPSTPEDPEFDPDGVRQPKTPGLPEKPRLEGRKFTELPLKSKDSELSGLCSIM